MTRGHSPAGGRGRRAVLWAKVALASFVHFLFMVLQAYKRDSPAESSVPSVYSSFKVSLQSEMMTLNVTLAVLCAATVCLCAPNDGSQYVACRSSADCGAGRCCVFVNGRYPTTSCEARRRLGASCRPQSQPFSQALNYPGGASVQVKDVYQGLCPCDLGLSCLRAECKM